MRIVSATGQDTAKGQQGKGTDTAMRCEIAITSRVRCVGSNSSAPLKKIMKPKSHCIVVPRSFFGQLCG